MRHGCLVWWAVLAACASEPTLSTTQQEAVFVSPTTHEFGTITVGNVSAPQTITVNPSLGNNNDTIESITGANCPDFVIDAPGLPFVVYRVCETCFECEPLAAPCQTIDFQSYQFTTTFRPSIAGPQSCVVTISMNGGTSTKTLTLSGTGNPPPFDIDVVPGAIPFGDVRIGTPSTPANVAVRNFGSQTLSVTGVTVPAGYVLNGPTAFGVGPGGTTNLSLQCQPGGVGPIGGALSITSNDPQTPTVNVPLSCNGVDSNIVITPSPAVYTTRVGQPLMQSISIVNSGGVATTLLGVSLSGTGITLASAPPANTPLPAAGGTAGVVVAFEAAVEGEASAMLSVVTPEGTRTSQITATALLASMSLSPDGVVDFGPVCTGNTRTQGFTVLGNGKGAFELQSIETPAPPFTLVAPALPATIQGSGANQVKFEISAAPLEPGLVTSTIAVGTDIPNAGPRTLELSVTGLGLGVSATPAEVDLGTEPLQVTTIGQPLSLTNCNPEPTTFSNARLSGPNADEFAIVAEPTTTTLAQGESAQWLVVFTPRTIGLKGATFEVDTPEGTKTILITAEGLGDLGGGARSYLTCNAGGMAQLGGTLLVLVLVLGRRRPRGRS